VSAELAAYKARIAGLYDRAAPSYGRVGPAFFQQVGRRLVELAEIGPGSRVLDVACGRGAVLFPAAARGASVLGIDISAEMVRETTDEISQRRVANAEVRLGDAEALDVADGSFDAVLCSFAVFFFADLERVLARFARALRPGGVVGLGLADDMDPRWAWQNELMMRHGRVEPPPAAVATNRELRAPGGLVGAMERAGLVGCREVREEIALAFRDAEEWWESLWTHGTRSVMESMGTEALEQFRAEGTARVAALARAGGLGQRMGLIYVLGRAPG
jgi:SAM-dependent methyltransferase